MRRAAALLATAALAACAPDAWKRDPAYNAFLEKISKECHPHSIGGIQVWNLTSDAYFTDQTSRLFHKSISPRQYVTAINAFYKGNNAAALDCILQRVPR